MPQVNLTAKEINAIVQIIRIAMEYDESEVKIYIKPVELNALRNKLQNVKDV